MNDRVAALRRFNRFYTRQVGTLQEHLLQSEYSLAETRVLFELAARRGVTAAAIGGELGLDAGYLSRMLRKFRVRGLVRRRRLAGDGRATRLELSARGRAVFGALDRRAEALAASLLAPLATEGQAELVGAMARIEALLGNASGAPIVLRPHRVGDMGWVVERHAALYAAEYAWDEGFEALVARIVADFIERFDPKRERCWIAEREGARLGCIFLVRHPERADTAKLRLLLVEPAARGAGLGRALVRECVTFARTSGYKTLTLWTQSNLAAAHHLYVEAGFQKLQEAPHHSFGVDLVEQTWELAL
ncbi:MAG: bifunctional helix-turn-helix transcriptional regulator/GNAT family N-acetyltransferase [Terriglobales bacterium]